MVGGFICFLLFIHFRNDYRLPHLTHYFLGKGFKAPIVSSSCSVGARSRFPARDLFGRLHFGAPLGALPLFFVLVAYGKKTWLCFGLFLKVCFMCS